MQLDDLNEEQKKVIVNLLKYSSSTMENDILDALDDALDEWMFRSKVEDVMDELIFECENTKNEIRKVIKFDGEDE